MEQLHQHTPEQDNRDFSYDQANDRTTMMTDLEKCMKQLENEGYTDQMRVEGGKLHNLTQDKKYKPNDVKAINFYRFEGITDPDDMSILYAIETVDGKKGTLVDAYGRYADGDTGDFMKKVEIHKETNKW